MAPEPDTCASATTSRKRTTDPCLDTVVPIQSLRLLTKSYCLDLAALKKHAGDCSRDKHQRARQKRLKSIEAMLLLLSIALYSEYVTDAERAALGLKQHPRRRQSPTRN